MTMQNYKLFFSPKMFTKLAFSLFFLFPLFYQTALPSFLAPITKDSTTHKYILSIYLSTPPHPTNLLLDLGAPSTLLPCTYNSSSSRYNSSTSTTMKPGPGPVTAQPVVDSLSLPTTNGLNPGPLGLIPRFEFSCTNRSSLKGLPKSASGLASLGRSNFSIPAQVSKSSSLKAVFALCLSGSPSATGLAFFGSTGPYRFIPEIDLSKHLNYTPLLNTVVTTVTTEYFIGLTEIKVNDKAIHFNPTAVTKLSTVTPYTVLQSSIYTSLVDAFVAAVNLTVTEPVKPFGVCYSADDVTSSRVGPAVATVDFVLQGGVIWRIFGSNLMVRIYRDGVHVWCLAFLDGGARPKTAVVIGGHQMEDNLLQFDLGLERLGFSSSVLVHGTMCANFNFTINNSLIR